MKFGRKEVYESACKLCGQLISNVRQIRIDNDNNNNNDNNDNNDNDNYYNGYTSLSPYCHNFSNLLLSKIESKINLKDGIDNIATCICSISKYCPEFLERSLFLRIMTTFRRLKPRGRYEFLQAVYNSSGHFFSSSSSSSPSATYTFGDNNNINNANSNNYDNNYNNYNNYNNNDRGTENWENDGDINDEKEHERVNERKQERGRDGRSGGMSVIDHLRPFISSLLADLSTVVIRYEDSSLDSSIPDSDPGSLLPRRRLPMVQLLTVKLLIRYAETLDITLIDQLVRSDTQGNDSGDLGSDSITDGFGLSLVLNEKAVLTV